jgi:hypothetical protein
MGLDAADRLAVEPDGIPLRREQAGDGAEQGALAGAICADHCHCLAFLDGQIAQLKAKRASMTTDTKDWDMAMKEVLDSRSLLTGRIRDLSKADTPEAWADAKEKAGQAWKRSQEAVDRMGQTVTTG